MLLMILGQPQQAEQTLAFEMLEPLTGTVGGFLELSQMLTGNVPELFIDLSTYLTGEVPATPESYAGVLDSMMSAGGMPVASFDWNSEREGGTKMSVTVIGDARGATVPAVTVKIGDYQGAYAAAGTLPEWEYERSAEGETTTLHASDALLNGKTTLPELVPWEAKPRAVNQAQVAQVPVSQRTAASLDPRRMPVDAVVVQALATVPHRLLISPPFPGYDFRAAGDGPSYSTLGKTPAEVVNDIWGKVGYTAYWQGGVLIVRGPGVSGDYILPAPIGSERIERITLDAPSISLDGGSPANDDPANSAALSPDPAERNGKNSSTDSQETAPTPQIDSATMYTIALSWDTVKGATDYILDRRIKGDVAYGGWHTVAEGMATRWTDGGASPDTTYDYRLRANAMNEKGEVAALQVSGTATVTTPKLPEPGKPSAPESLEGYYRSTDTVGVKWKPPKKDEDHPAADSYTVDVLRDGLLLRSFETYQTYQVVDALPVGAKLQVRVTAHAGHEKGEPALLDVQLANLRPAPAGTVTLTPRENKDKVWTAGLTTSFTASWELIDGASEYELQVAIADNEPPESALVWRDTIYKKAPTKPSDIKKPADGKEEEKKTEDTTLKLPVIGRTFETRYAVRVRGTNEKGGGKWSEVAYITTEAAPPAADPDPEMSGFAGSTTGKVTTSRRTANLATENTVWKQGGRVIATQAVQVGKVALIEGDTEAKATPKSVWMPLNVATLRNYYELKSWPLTLTGSARESITFDRTPGRSGEVAGREQEQIHQEWSPQGWLNRRTTIRSKTAWVIGETDDEGNVKQRKMGNQREYLLETWTPLGNGLWLYEKTGTISTLTPFFDATTGDWTHMETAVKPHPDCATEVTDQAPEQATLPEATKQAVKKTGDVPPITRNTTSKALDLKLDDQWFSTPSTPNVTGDNGPKAESNPDKDKPPTPKDEGEPTPAGSSDTSGHPEADPVPPVPADALSTKLGGAEGGNGASIQSSLPWVRTQAGLTYYANMLAQQGGRRERVTRTYLLPTQPPSLDRVLSVSVQGGDSFEMTVVTERGIT